jgi:hypothetical protein
MRLDLHSQRHVDVIQGVVKEPLSISSLISFLQFKTKPTSPTKFLTMSPSNNNNNSNNNSGAFCNRYIVPSAGPSTSNQRHLSDDEVRLAALAARVQAACVANQQGRIGHQAGYIPHALRRSATMPARFSAPAASGSRSNSNRASNGSNSMRAPTRNSDHIRRGPVLQLPKADKPAKAPTGGIAHKNLVREQSAKFREALTKDSFPPLVPGNLALNTRPDLRRLCLILGMRLVQRQRTGFLYRRKRKMYFGGDLGLGFAPSTGPHGRSMEKLMKWHQEMVHLELHRWV